MTTDELDDKDFEPNEPAEDPLKEGVALQLGRLSWEDSASYNSSIYWQIQVSTEGLEDLD
jgi:hypothetical protein